MLLVSSDSNAVLSLSRRVTGLGSLTGNRYEAVKASMVEKLVRIAFDINNNIAEECILSNGLEM